MRAEAGSVLRERARDGSEPVTDDGRRGDRSIELGWAAEPAAISFLIC